MTGISVVNAATPGRSALDFRHVEGAVFSGIAGGVDPQFDIGDVITARRRGQ